MSREEARSYPPAVLAAAAAEARLHYPREACGVVIARGEELTFVPVPNAIDRFHEADPEAFPVDSRGAYLLDPATQRRLWQGAERGEFSVVAIVHSHCDTDAAFSELDREWATTEAGSPLHPGLDYLVISVVAHRVVEAQAHRYVDGAWRSRPLGIPSHGESKALDPMFDKR